MKCGVKAFLVSSVGVVRVTVRATVRNWCAYVTVLGWVGLPGACDSAGGGGINRGVACLVCVCVTVPGSCVPGACTSVKGWGGVGSVRV